MPTRRRPAFRRLWLGIATLCVAAPIAGAVLGAAFPSALRIPRRDSVRAPVPPPALFSHRTHGSFGCFSCHPNTFPEAPLAFTHDDMKRGNYCARCHDGRVAFAVTGARCEGCHAPVR